MPRADLTLILFWTSLGISAAAVVLFLWLMREEGSDAPPHSKGPPEGGPGGVGA